MTVPNYRSSAHRPVRTHRVAVAARRSRQDPYYWLRDDTRSDPEVLAHLAAETAYAEAVLAPSKCADR